MANYYFDIVLRNRHNKKSYINLHRSFIKLTLTQDRFKNSERSKKKNYHTSEQMFIMLKKT